MSSIHVSYHLTSPYKSSSNGLVERNLAKIKNALLKLGRVTKEVLQKVVYELNCLEHQDGSLSPNSKFLSRGVRSYSPNSLSEEVDRRALVERRQAVQERIANRKGNKSKNCFAVGDKVRVKSNLDGRWATKGTIQEARPSGSSSPPASFIILTDSGKEVIRHKSYLKHEVLDTDIDLGGMAAAMPADLDSPSAARPVPNDTHSVPVPGPTGQENMHPGHVSTEPVMEGA